MWCMFDIALRRRWSDLTRLTLSFANIVTHCIWKRQSPLRRFPNVTEWPRYFDLTPPDLGELVGALKMGWTLHLARAAVSEGDE